ncbi:hypothetical protein BEH76_17835 [Shewanella algae]|nr:hypothetical protein BEH76_17835 [Shewanella algae]
MDYRLIGLLPRAPAFKPSISGTCLYLPLPVRATQTRLQRKLLNHGATGQEKHSLVDKGDWRWFCVLCVAAGAVEGGYWGKMLVKLRFLVALPHNWRNRLLEPFFIG